MAVGSNTLGLLFKIGVDAKDAEQQVSGLQKIVGDLGGSFAKGFGEGAIKGAKDFEKAAASSTATLQNLGATAQQARAGMQEVFSGNVVEGAINLTRSLGPIGIALAGVAAAAAAVAFAIKGAIDAAHDIGTTSKSDFDELQKKVQSAGQSITELQRAMAGGVLDALDKISGATTAFFAKLLEKDGKALILLLQEIANFITDKLIPLVDTFAGDIEDAIVNLIAAFKSIPALQQAIQEEQKRGLAANLKDTFKFIATGELGEADQKILDIYKNTVAGVRKELETIHPAARTLIDDHTAATKAVKDLTAAQLEQNRAQRALSEAEADAAAQRAEIDRQLKAGAITAEEAAGRRLAIEQNLKFAEDSLLDAQQKRIDAEVKGENARTDAFEANASKRVIAEKRAAADQAAINAQQEKDQIKQDEDRLKRLDAILNAGQEIGDAVIKGQARVAQQIPGGATGVLGLPDPAVVQDQLDQIHKSLQDTLVDKLAKIFEESSLIVSDWGQTLVNVLSGVANALEKTFQNFILTGKIGADAIKSLTATILAQLAIEAFFMVLKENAKAAAETAEALADLAYGDFVGFTLHSIAASAHHKAAIQWGLIGGGAAAAGIGIGLAGGLGGGTKQAAAGGTFGSNQAPGTVTINQGQAIASLGIAVDNLNNKISSMSPGDVVTVGANQNPAAIGQANNEAARRDGTVSRQFLEIAGLRPA